MTIRIGFDIGGTFTDFVLLDSISNRLVFHKTLSTPSDLTRGVIDGIATLVDKSGISAQDVSHVLHATTIATNAVLERSGSRTALITTRGFRDVLIIGRQKRYNTFDLYLDKPQPLIARKFIYEVAERVAFDGGVVEPLDIEAVDRAIADIKEAGIESVAVALLHSYANASHERQILERLRALAPEIEVTLSSDISPKYREYERTSTTVANAYVKPIVAHYIDRLRNALQDRRLNGGIYIMQSNGGLVSPQLAREYPVRIIESGPAAGVLMCAAAGHSEDFNRVLTFDMGGTTAKLGAVDGGVPVITPTFEVDSKHFRKFSGLPLNVPAIELLEIGAGGGSLAAADMGLIRVGPASAGAEPGPACYGRGGTRPTVTDANLIIGYLNPHYFNGGAMKLDVEAARAAISTHIAAPLGLSLGAAAWGIHAVANSSMETAMRVISVERGRDPQHYALVAFGGAGPLHAARLARILRIPTVIVPRGAGVGSAIGLLTAEPRLDVSVTRILTLQDKCHGEIARIYDELARRARAEYEQLDLDRAPKLTRQAYLRYAGQGFEIKVDLPEGAIDVDYVTAITNAFHKAYERTYGYRDNDAAIEGIDWQLAASFPDPDAKTIFNVPVDVAANANPVVSKRQAYFPESGGFIACDVVDRYKMTPGVAMSGPAIIEEVESTTVVLPDDLFQLSPRGNLMISVKQGAGR